MNRSLACLIPALLLGACSTAPGEYPSLARRPIERASGVFQPPPPPPPPAQIDRATFDRLDSLLARVLAADARFQGAVPAADRQSQSAIGAVKGSEAWSLASVALSVLETSRSEAMIALADIDAIYAATQIDGKNADEPKRARDAVALVIAKQDRIINGLQERLAN